MAAALKLTADVLHVRAFGEAHRVVELFSAEVGRISAIARHARASRRRFAGALDLFVRLEATVTPGATLWTLDEAKPLDARVGIRDSLAGIERASLLCAAVRRLVPEGEAAPEIAQALATALDALATGDLVSAAGFYPRLLLLTGILPSGERVAEPLRAALAGAPCQDETTAQAVEAWTLQVIEAQVGRPVRGRVGYV